MEIPFGLTLTGEAFKLAEGISIKQKKVSEVISNHMYNLYLYPFLLTTDYFIEKDSSIRATFQGFFKTDQNGKFAFQENGIPLITYLMLGLQYFFDTKNVKFGLKDTIIIDDSFVITQNNYEEISDIIAGLNGRKRIRKLVPPENLNDVQRDIWIKTMKGRQRKAEKESIDFNDIVNIVIHYNGDFKYKETLDLTILQLYNTFNVYMQKDKFDRYYQLYSSGQFEMKEHTPHWINSIQEKNNN